MDFGLSDDQRLLRDSVGRFLEREYGFAARSGIVAAGGISFEKWRGFAELGWLGACLPEAAGGYGGGPVEAMLIMEGFGRHLVVEPFVETVVTGGQLLQGLPGPVRNPLVERMIGGDLQIALATAERQSRFDLADVVTEARTTGDGWELHGVKPIVANGAVADLIFVTARTSGNRADVDGVTLFMVDRGAPDVSVRPFLTHDGRNAAEIGLDGVRVGGNAVVGDIGAGLAVVEQACDHGLAALCAEAVGSADYLLSTTAAHLKQREQYGGPLARLQVLQHRLAEMYVATELARSAAILATLSLDEPDTQRKRAVSGARVQAIQSLRFVAQQAVQLHGGMGVSEELDIAHHLKRSVVAGMHYGDEAWHLARFIALDPDAAPPAAPTSEGSSW